MAGGVKGVDGDGEPTASDPNAATLRNEASGLTRNEQIGHYIAMWKQSVEVQMHFNDIEWRIRGLALTVATFALGAASLAAKDGSRVGPVSVGSVLILVSLALWYAFYFVDSAWYHPLLKGAVDKGAEIEAEIMKDLPRAGLTDLITERSVLPTSGLVRSLSRKKEMHSQDKLVWFYKVGAFALAAAAIALQVAVLVVDTSAVTVPSEPAASQVEDRQG